MEGPGGKNHTCGKHKTACAGHYLPNVKNKNPAVETAAAKTTRSACADLILGQNANHSALLRQPDRFCQPQQID